MHSWVMINNLSLLIDFIDAPIILIKDFICPQYETIYPIENASWKNDSIYGCKAEYISKAQLINGRTRLMEQSLMVYRKLLFIRSSNFQRFRT